jgi:hypothetical protein
LEQWIDRLFGGDKAGTPSGAVKTTTTTTTTTLRDGALPPRATPPSSDPTSDPTWEGTPTRATTPAPKPSKPAPSKPAPSKPTPSKPAPSKPSSGDPATLSQDKFFKLSDDALMQAVRDGKIPSAVTDSKAGMLELQARMDQISEMNQLMTTMMQSMHQMKMSVIENLRA